MNRALLFGALAIGTLLAPISGACADDQVIRIGVMNDMSGPYVDFQGPGSVLAAQMAVEDYGGKAAGRKVEILSADHQNKPDVGAAIARQWIDTQGVDAIADLPNSAVALAVNQITKDKNKVLLASGAGTDALTGAQCTPNTVQWTYDTYELGHAAARAVMERGGKSWYFITADYAFGHDLQNQASDEVTKDGGKVVGSAAHPIGASDFSSFLLQAQSSGAQVIALANAGADESNTLKQAVEFDLTKNHTMIGLVFGLQNVSALGLPAAQGLMTVQAWYWDLNDNTRAFAKRYQARMSNHSMPNDMHAGMYSVVLHYLKAIDKVGSAADGKKVVDAMKAIPVDDAVYGKGSIRADGRGLHPVYLTQVKTPGESKGDWDYFKILATIPADQAFRPLAEGKCSFVQASR
ncbi:MAG: ABC transporter substrate-binding protein [Xanthobacteraceae bacterium]|jgi:branched-chain amino acid transport system substrate-binding protein